MLSFKQEKFSFLKRMTNCGFDLGGFLSSSSSHSYSHIYKTNHHRNHNLTLMCACACGRLKRRNFLLIHLQYEGGMRKNIIKKSAYQSVKNIKIPFTLHFCNFDVFITLFRIRFIKCCGFF